MRHLLLVFFALLLLGCAGSKSTAAREDTGILGPGERGTEVIVERADARDLTDYLATMTGVTVRGRGPNASITIRGIKSVQLTNEPLFVLDGTPAGYGIAGVYSAVNVNEIDRIRVLKNANDLAAYGSRGANGVIEIFTKK